MGYFHLGSIAIIVGLLTFMWQEYRHDIKAADRAQIAAQQEKKHKELVAKLDALTAHLHAVDAKAEKSFQRKETKIIYRETQIEEEAEKEPPSNIPCSLNQPAPFPLY